MSKGKFSLTDFRSFNSRDLLTKSCKVQESNRSQYSPYRSAFSRKDLIHRSKMDDIQNLIKNTHASGLKDIPTVEEFTIHSKQALGSARLPSFNIKKLLSGQVKKKSEEKLHVPSHIFAPDPQRSGTSHMGMKRYWQKYLNEEISYGDLTKQLNRNIVDGTRRERRNQSQIRTKENREDSKQKIERSAFYVNNFIKTRYRKRRAEEAGEQSNEGAKKEEVVVVIPAKQPKQPKQPKEQPRHSKQQEPSVSQRLTPLRNKKSWQMIPWQKFNDPEQQEFSPLHLQP